MHATERERMILDLMQGRGFASFQELDAKLEASPATIRRDLERMSRADTDLFSPHATSRLRTLWTLWRASKSRAFGG